MKITCEASAFLRALALVQPAVSSRPRVPILASVLLAAEGDRVRIAATDLGLGIACWLPAIVEREGAVAIPFARLFNFIAGQARSPQAEARRKGSARERPAPPSVVLEASSDPLRVSLGCGRRSALLAGAPASEFPLLPTLAQNVEAGGEAMRLDLPAFCAMVKKVAFAADPKDGRASYAGVSLRSQDGRLTLAARSTLLLATCEGPVQVSGAAPSALVLPAQNLLTIARLLEGTGHSEALAVVSDESQRILFHVADLDLVSYLPEQQEVLDTNQAWPSGPAARVVVEGAALAAALRFVEFVARRNGEFRAELTVSPTLGTLLVEARDSEMGEQATEIEIASAVAPAEFRCGPFFFLLDQVVAAAGASSISLEWFALPGILVLGSQDADTAVRARYALLQTKTVAGHEQGGQQ